MDISFNLENVNKQLINKCKQGKRGFLHFAWKVSDRSKDCIFYRVVVILQTLQMKWSVWACWQSFTPSFLPSTEKNFAKTAKHLVLYYASEVKLRHIGEYCLNLDLKRTWEPGGNSIIRDSSQNRYPHIFEDIQILMYSTVSKWRNFSAPQILCEFNFVISEFWVC